MEWIFIGLAVLIGVVLLVYFALTAKRQEGATIPGRFDFSRFDHYKSEELSRRGVQDKTKWR